MTSERVAPPRPLAQPFERLGTRYDAVVVGSGYGGGVAASRLARAGRRVCVLERGREFLTGEFPSRFPDIRRELQVTGPRLRLGSRTGLFDVRQGEHLHVLVGCGLGGGSLVNAAVAMRPDERVFAHAAWPPQVGSDGLLDEGFARARAMLRPAAYPEPHRLTKYQALERASRAIGVAPHAAPVVVSFAETVNPAGVRQAACTLCGDCCSGCNVGAKNTIALTYLPDACAHGAALFTHSTVSHIERGEGLWRVVVERSDGPEGRRERRTVEAELVVLAAGTLGSTEILLRSRERGLALSEALGTRFSANGDIIAFGYGAKVPVNAIGIGHPPKAGLAPVGACVAGQIEIRHDDDLDHSLYIQEGVLPSALAPLLPVLFLPGGRLLGAAQSLIKGVYKGPFANLHTFFVVSHDSAEGRIVLKNGVATIDWPDVAEQPVYARVDAVLEKAVRANGGTYIKNPLAGTFMGHAPATAHPLGGCAMGVDRSCGVVNHKGQVFDAASERPDAVHDGLYVCDGAVIPRSLGVNPLLTITALAERAMQHLAQDRGWSFDVDALAEHALIELGEDHQQGDDAEGRTG